MVVTTSTAHAAKAVYPTDENARTLNAGLAGYTSSTSSEGLCVPVLLCPTVSNTYEPSGGVNGTGYIRTGLGSLLGVGATSIGTFTSPAFTYNGVQGKAADRLAVKLARRSDVAALLQVAGNSATYSVDLINSSGGASVSVINNADLSGLSDFAEQSVDIDPSSLKLGQSYQIRITSRFTSGAQVLPGGSADYDNIRVQAKAKLGGGGGGNGGGGSGGGGNGGGGGGNGGNGGNGGGNGGNGGHAGNGGRLSGKCVLRRNAKLRGDRLVVRVRAKRNPKGRCKVQLQARLKRHGANVTNRRTARVRPGRERRISLNVRNRYRSKVARRKKVVIKKIVRRAGKSATSYKKVRVNVHH